MNVVELGFWEAPTVTLTAHSMPSIAFCVAPQARPCERLRVTFALHARQELPSVRETDVIIAAGKTRA